MLEWFCGEEHSDFFRGGEIYTSDSFSSVRAKALVNSEFCLSPAFKGGVDGNPYR